MIEELMIKSDVTYDAINDVSDIVNHWSGIEDKVR